MLSMGRAFAWGAGGVMALAAVGCGSSGTYKNLPRPPAPINVSAEIGRNGVSVSPNRFGAGPIDLTITNQTGRTQRLVLVTNEGAGLRAITAPIAPRDTADLKANLFSASYAVVVSGGGLRAAVLHVGRKRPSAQNQLLQP
jgi:hypothetical protein